MLGIVADIGLFLFWLTLVWLPLVAGRLVAARAPARLWHGAVLIMVVLVLFASSHMLTGLPGAAQAVSLLIWAVPVCLIVLARARPGVPWLKMDKFIALIAILTFFPASFVQVPAGLLFLVNSALWS